MLYNFLVLSFEILPVFLFQINKLNEIYYLKMFISSL